MGMDGERMTRYYVYYHVCLEVEANTDEEAIEKADEANLNDCISCEIDEVEEKCN